MARLGDSVAKQEIQPFRCSIFFGSVDREMRCNLRFGNLFVNEVCTKLHCKVRNISSSKNNAISLYFLSKLNFQIFCIFCAFCIVDMLQNCTLICHSFSPLIGLNFDLFVLCTTNVSKTFIRGGILFSQAVIFSCLIT